MISYFTPQNLNPIALLVIADKAQSAFLELSLVNFQLLLELTDSVPKFDFGLGVGGENSYLKRDESGKLSFKNLYNLEWKTPF